MSAASAAAPQPWLVTKHCRSARAPRLCEIHWDRRQTNHLRRRMQERPIAYHWLAERYPERRTRIMVYWAGTLAVTRRRWHHYQRVTPTGAIRAAFGAAASEALTVARCESGLSPRASNGQFYGLFQLSSYIRYTRPGVPHAAGSVDPLLQARAAAAVYRQDGASWREWSCQP